ncbi:MAG: rod shape-determining protein RodA [Gammaproteobacteria bacterium]|nr:rod shape-determining protein RodA [Gammaproteobacteria bacterium]
MSNQDFVRSLPQYSGFGARARLRQVHLDPVMLLGLAAIIGIGLMVLYSAVDRNMVLFNNQLMRMGIAVAAMVVAAQFRPRFYLRWTPLFYLGGLLMLVLVLVMGVTVKGSQRWLDLPGLPRFQPSEIMKIAVPLMVAWYFHDRPLPPSLSDLLMAMLIIAVPAACIILQPDLGTGILVACAGAAVVVLAGLRWKWLFMGAVVAALAAPGLWYLLQDYQRQRILTLFDPNSDPLGAGWNIIQSTTAIGSGGIYGKGLFEGTQSHLDFLPESHTDFIIAVIGEELGLVGVLTMLALYLLVVARGLYIATQAPHTFERLVAGALTLTFFVYVFVNVAMVCGLLPVVGVPLPLVSYGGSSAITLMASFGVIMAVRTHRGW